jgi:hypothetical protein
LKKKFFVRKSFLSEKVFCQKKFFVRKSFLSEKLFFSLKLCPQLSSHSSLTAARYTNQGGAACHFRDFHVICDGPNVELNGYIGKSQAAQTIQWDNDVLGVTYEYESNEPSTIFDTAIRKVKYFK